jgi:hypothetical protein
MPGLLAATRLVIFLSEGVDGLARRASPSTPSLKRRCERRRREESRQERSPRVRTLVWNIRDDSYRDDMGHPECFEPRFDLCSIRFSSGVARGCKPFAGVGGVSPPFLLLSSRRLRRRRKGGKRVFRGHPEPRQGRYAPCTLVFRTEVRKIRDDPWRRGTVGAEAAARGAKKQNWKALDDLRSLTIILLI